MGICLQREFIFSQPLNFLSQVSVYPVPSSSPTWLTLGMGWDFQEMLAPHLLCFAPGVIRLLLETPPQLEELISSLTVLQGETAARVTFSMTKERS